MWTVVVIVLLLTGRAALYTFTGGTENGSFTCHCAPDVQCDDDTGACPGDACDSGWHSTACQLGNVALLGTITEHTGGSSYGPGRCIDGDTSTDITQGSCCNPTRSRGELSWTVHLGRTFAVSDVFIIATADDYYRDTIRDANVYVSAGRFPTEDELCGSLGRFMSVQCPTMIGSHVTIAQPNMTIDEMMFCDVHVEGYEYYPCGFYYGDYRYGPGCVENCHCENQCDVITGECGGDCTSGWSRYDDGACGLPCTTGYWGASCHPCRCLDVAEVCNVTTGHCESGCDDRYIGDGCNVVKPTLRDATITLTEDNDVVTVTITDIKYMTELVSEYLVQYKPLHGRTFMSINVNPVSKRRRRAVGVVVVLQIPFFDQAINSQYEFRITPLISSPEYDGVVGVSSNIIMDNSGCLQYTGLPSCNHWCVCSNDPGTLCLLTCDYCHVCDSEPELPSGENVDIEITDITSDSMRIQFIGTDPDLPPILLFVTRLGDHYANISSWVSNADYTYNGLHPHTAYAIEVAAVLEDGVLSKPWTLTAIRMCGVSYCGCFDDSCYCHSS